jgi:hypothetical protein
MPVALRSLSRKPKAAPKPESDPRFAKIVEDLKRKSAKVKQHPTPKQKAAEAQAAAKGPPNERAAGGKAKQVDKIKEAKTKKPEPNSFLALLRAEIEKAMPKTLGDTEKFMKGGDAGAMKGSLKGNVNQQKQEATGDVSSASKQSPGEAGEAKQSQPIPGEPQPPSPEVDAAAGMPAPKPEGDVSLQDSKQDTDAAMADAEVTPTQLKKANDPRFSSVLTAKDTVAKQADAAPAKFRAGERGVLTSVGAQAKAVSKQGAGAMLGNKTKSKSAVQLRQEAAKKKDELERKKVADDIEAIYNKTKTNVENKLASLETEVGAMFDGGTDAALSAMKSYVEDRIFRYKLERYLSIPVVGAARWVADQFMGLPDEVNVFYVEGRNLFTRMMDALVVRVANLVEKRLSEAKAMVASGQNEIKLYVSKLAPNLRSVGESAQKEMAGRFKELEQGIENKKNELAQSLAQKYKEASEKADKALKEIQDSNKGLVQAFVEKLGEIIKILAEFKDKLMALLKKGADAIKLILADPIGFLSNLIGAIKQGFNQFKANIKTWLIKGLIGWLFGALASAGVTPPADFSLPSIFKLVMQILGLTYENMRAKAVKLLGPTAVTVIEKLVDYVKTFITGGPAKLWEQIKGDLSNLKDMVLGAIRDMIIETVIKAAVTKVLSMFNPAGAIIQAIMAIYNTVMFVIEQGAQIMSFVDAIINSVTAIAQGAIGAAASKVEQALGSAIPLVIGFLARLIGLGDIPKRATATVKKVQGVIDAAIDKFLSKAIAFVKKMFGKLGGKERTPEEKKKDLERAGRELKPKVKAFMRKGVPPVVLKARLALWKMQYKLTTLEMRGRELVATINPELKLAEGWTFEDKDVFLIIDKIAKEMIKEAQKERAKENRERKKKGVPPPAPVTLPGGGTQQQVDIRQRSSPGAGVVALGPGEQRVIVGQTAGGKEVAFEHGFEQAPYQRGPFPWRGIGPGGGAKGRKYDDLAASMSGKPVGDWLKMLATGKPLPEKAEQHAGELAELYGLMMAKEPSHNAGAHRRDLAYSMMAIDLASGPGGKPIEQIVGKTGIHPAAFGEAQMGAGIVTMDIKGTRGIGALTKDESAALDKRQERERETLKAWFEKHKSALPVFPDDKKPTLADVETFVRSKLKEIFKR